MSIGFHSIARQILERIVLAIAFQKNPGIGGICSTRLPRMTVEHRNQNQDYLG